MQHVLDLHVGLNYFSSNRPKAGLEEDFLKQTVIYFELCHFKQDCEEKIKIVNSIFYKKFIQFLMTRIRGVMNGEVTFSFRMDQHTAVVFVF